MKNFQILTDVIEYIENNLDACLTREQVSRYCYTSVSSIEKLFRYALHLSIKEYIDKRIMTNAAKDLIENDESITEIAMKYGYASVEVFSRTFKRVWNINPSSFRKERKFTGIFPKIKYEYKTEEGKEMPTKKVDISDMYEYLHEKRGTYVVCFDIKNLLSANKISRKLGDLLILEAASSIEKSSTDDMAVMRIGGDEFALVTGYSDYEATQKVMEDILSKNGTPVKFDENEFPLFLYGCITKIPEPFRFNEMLNEMHDVIIESKKKSI